MSVATAKLEDLKGRRGVDIGQSFIRAWNERTGKTTKRSKDYPNPEFYSLRYAFQPESIDNEGAGTLAPKATSENRIYELERPSLSGGDPHRFTAVEQPSKEWECILLWDPDTQTLKLEKLESNLNVSLQKTGGAASNSSQSKSSKPIAKAAITSARKADKEFEDMERALGGESDAEGELDDDLIESILEQMPKREEEEEEEEEEEMEPVELEPPPVVVKATTTKPANPKGVRPKTVKTAPPKAKPKPRARTTAAAAATSTKRELAEDVDADEEELNFGLPSRPTKRSRTTKDSSVSSHSSHLALPALPSQHTSRPNHQPTPADLLQPPSMDRIPHPEDTDSDDADMHEVDLAPIEDETEAFGDVVDDFLNGMDARSDSGDDEGMEAVSIGAATPTQSRPLTLNEIAGEGSDDDDDTSSNSDDSDDDDD